MIGLKKEHACLIICFLLFISCALIQRSHVDYSISLSKEYLNRGDIQQALKASSVALNKYPKNLKLQKNYVKVFKYSKRRADSAFKNKNYAKAGTMYSMLLRTYPKSSTAAGKIPADKDFLKTRVKTCTETLTEKGLIEYREGDINSAISIWKSVLRFDPQNKAVKKAIITASLQLENLQNIP